MDGEGNGKDGSWVKLLLFLLFACGALVVALFTPVGQYFEKEKIQALAQSLGWWGPLGLLAVSLVMPLLFLPRWPVAWVCGLLYGITMGTLIATVASTCGACLHFFLARTLLAPSARKALKRVGIKNDSIPDDKMFYAFFFLRAFPLSNFVATNLLAGALKVRVRVYVAATFFGMIPSSIMYASWGKVMKEQSSSVTGTLILSVLFIIVGCIVARKYFAPWFRALKEEDSPEPVA